MTTINHYINRYHNDQEFKEKVYIVSGTVATGAILYSLLYIGTLIGYLM